MRFERLRLYLGVALVIFVLVTANIILLGKVENRILADINGVQCPVVTKDEINNVTALPSGQVQPTQTQTTTSVVKTPVVMPSNTRAS